MILKGNNLEIKIKVFFCYQTSTQIIAKWQNVTPTQKRDNIPIQKSTHIWEPLFFKEVLQFEATVPLLRAFHTNLHPPTHVQLEVPTINI